MAQFWLASSRIFAGVDNLAKGCIKMAAKREKVFVENPSFNPLTPF